MTDNDFDTQRTELANRFASAGAEFLGQMPLAAAALAEVPNTQPQQYAMVGEPRAIRALLPEDDMPARRMRHGQRPTEPLEWDVPAIANKATEEGELPVIPAHWESKAQWIVSGPKLESDERGRLAVMLLRVLLAADRASRQVANKAEVEPLYQVAAPEVVQSFALEDGRCVMGDPDLSVLKDGTYWICKAPVYSATPPATTGASTALFDAERLYKAWHKIGADVAGLKFGDFMSALGSVGASTAFMPTALTDERISAGARWLSNHQADACGVDREDNWKLYGGSIIEEFREACTAAFGTQVAAQAGQVAVPEGFVLMPRRLTAENGAKGLLSGEFHESTDIECPECLGDGDDSYGDDCPECSGTGKVQQRITVEWDTIKRIYDMAVENLAATPAAPAQAKPLPAAEVPAPAAPKQCWSLNDEGFSHDSLSELLDNYPDLKAGAQVFTGMAVYPALSRLIDSDDVIDQMGDRAYDIAGEYADGYPDVSTENKAELDALLEGWIKKACPPDFYEVRDVRTYVITEQDIAAQASTAGGRQEGGV